jgi:uncharacterized protein
MKRLLVLLVLGFLSATACVAQQAASDQPASKEDVERYLDVTHTRELMISTMEYMSKQMRQAVHEELQKTPNLPPDAEAQMNQTWDQILKTMPMDEFLDSMIPVYQKHCTKGDIDSLVAFYSTPTGKKMVAEMPAITQEAMLAASGVVRKFMDQAMQQMQDQIAQMQKNSQPDPKKAASTN